MISPYKPIEDIQFEQERQQKAEIVCAAIKDVLARKDEMGEIDMSGVDSVSAMIILRVFRDAGGNLGTDNYGSDAFLLELDFHYQIDSEGSREEYIKY